MIGPRLSSVLLCALLALLPGCQSYRLGTSAQLSFRSLYIAPITMRALLPQAQPILSTHVREAFARDGRVTLVNDAGQAEATLQILVRDYHREVATVRPGDTGLARKFQVTLTAEATLIDNRTGQPLFESRPIVSTRDVFTDRGQQQAEYQILPLLAQDLAQKTAHAVLDTW